MFAGRAMFIPRDWRAMITVTRSLYFKIFLCFCVVSILVRTFIVITAAIEALAFQLFVRLV
jgi:hypothetical protein